MNPKPMRVVITAIATATLLVPLVVSPVAAACALSAPASVEIGAPLVIDGSGFPANGPVDVALTIEGGEPDEFVVQSNGTGDIQISLTPEAADAGVTTISATSGQCTAEAVIAVGVPVPTDAPEATGDGEGAAPPRTDAEPGRDGSPPAPAAGWVVAGLLLLIGVGGRFATRPAGHR